MTGPLSRRSFLGLLGAAAPVYFFAPKTGWLGPARVYSFKDVNGVRVPERTGMVFLESHLEMLDERIWRPLTFCRMQGETDIQLRRRLEEWPR